VGTEFLDGYKVAIAVMDFGFLAATMGSVVGEKITRTIEYGTAQRCGVVIVAGFRRRAHVRGNVELDADGENSGALAQHAHEQLPYISVLTKPTTAGVHGRFASLGDVIIAEPKKHDRFSPGRG